MRKIILFFTILNMYTSKIITAEKCQKFSYFKAIRHPKTHTILTTRDLTCILEQNDLRVGDTILLGKQKPIKFSIHGENISEEVIPSNTGTPSGMTQSAITKTGVIYLVSTLYNGKTTPLSERKSIEVKK